MPSRGGRVLSLGPTPLGSTQTSQGHSSGSASVPLLLGPSSHESLNRKEKPSNRVSILHLVVGTGDRCRNEREQSNPRRAAAGPRPGRGRGSRWPTPTRRGSSTPRAGAEPASSCAAARGDPESRAGGRSGAHRRKPPWAPQLEETPETPPSSRAEGLLLDGSAMRKHLIQ